MTPAKTWALRGAIAAAWIILGCALFISSRGHFLLIDNRSPENGDPAPDRIRVIVDNKPAMELLRGDRDRLTVTGTKHRVRVEFSDGRQPFEGAFTLPLKDDMYLLSAPRMLNGDENFVEVFRTTYESRTVEAEAPDETALEAAAP
ncbi:MAG: hypothetical protein LBB82_06690 [Treponema sp.]|jgi:hypothetical protein|nr:hypothetical protein [Treponema sp.]